MVLIHLTGRHQTLLVVLLGGAIVAAEARSAAAVDVLGMSVFGGTKSAPEGTLSYATKIDVEGDDPALADELRGVSILVSQQSDGAADPYALTARARADHERLLAALYAEARYGATVSITIDGRPLDEPGDGSIRSAKPDPIAVAVSVRPGPAFTYGAVTFEQSRPTDVAPVMDAMHYGLKQGAIARSTEIVAAIDRVREAWREHGYPLAQIVRKDIAADHARSAVDIHVTVDPGSPAVYGWVNVTGASNISTGTIADQSDLRSGQRFDARDIKKARERLRKLESVESVRVVEGARVDADGGIPVTIEVTERKPRFFGATASMSTLDGAELRAYWGHRNLLGEGERLRVDAVVSQIGENSIEESGFKFGMEFVKPGVWDIDTDLFSEFRLERDQPDYYESRFVKGRMGLNRRFNKRLSGSAAIGARYERIADVFGERDYLPVALDGELAYDSRDKKLDPSSGLHATALVKPTVDALADTAYVSASATVASYAAIDGNDTVILAGRVIANVIAGASPADVPASERIFAGGGGSVRGYEYRSLGPRIGGRVAGGLTAVGGSLEARIRVSEHLGIVPFVDAAAVSADTAMRFSGDFYIGAGIGLRYYTSLGPLRLDVAFPLSDSEGQAGYGVYLGLGQAF